METLEQFRARLRAWLPDNLPRLPAGKWDPLNDDDDRASGARALQAKLWEGGFAGICYPKEYGGLGLPIEYQKVFDEETAGLYQLPVIFSTPTHSICGPTILDCGTEEQKKRYLPKMFTGEELWVQFMSEPSGGSDMAGALTKATRDGDVFILNGSKIWSTYAYRADFALCLARTDSSVPKHRGLTMFIVPTHHPRTTMQQIQMVDGSREFCQEFFDDVDIPADNVVGKVNDGWTVASRLLFHEKSAVGAASPYVSVKRFQANAANARSLAQWAAARGRTADQHVRRRLGYLEVLETVEEQLTGRLRQGMRIKHFPDQGGAIARLYSGITRVEHANVAYEIASDGALVWDEPGRHEGFGVHYLQRQAACIGGGTTEMARNVISERVLGMPREPAADRDVPFAEVKRGR